MSHVKKKIFAVKPSRLGACIELCGGNTVAGGLLYQIAVLSRGKTITDEKGVSGWLVLSALQWKYMLRFSRSQHNDAIADLKALGLIQSRKRKFSFKDRNAWAWVRLSEKAKSAIAEIMALPGISAFGEIIGEDISAKTDNTPTPNSDLAESLMENETLENEDEDNVVINETTITESISSKEAESKEKEKKKKTKDTSLGNKEWFYKCMEEIYAGSPYTPEPYQESSAKILSNAADYLSKNPGKFFEYCSVESRTMEHVLNQIILNWEEFIWFTEAAYKGFNAPHSPQLYYINIQLKAVPDYIKFRGYMNDVHSIFPAHEKGGTSPESMKDIEHFQAYIKLPSAQRKGYLVKFKSKYEDSPANKALQKLIDAEKKKSAI